MHNLIMGSALLPHGFCYQWRPELLWTHVISDGVIAIAYFSIPLTLVYFLSKRKGLKLWWVVALFASFIVLCGTTHIFGILTVWEPAYATSAGVKFAAALVSIATAAAIVPLVPKALTLRTAEELTAANTALEAEVRLRKQAESKLASTVEELRRSNDELQQFAYVASHDLQAPLRSIVGFANLLERDLGDKLSEQERGYFEFIQQGGQHMRALISDLLELSRVDTSKKEHEPVDINEAADFVRQQLHGDIEESGAQLEMAGDMPVIEADASQFRQLLQNLIGNAIKFRRPDTAPVVSVSSSEESDQAHIVIQDNGIGIPADKIDSVFEVFRRLHGSDEYEGTGIGLAICRKVVEHHGGKIWVESEPGKGTAFHFTMPLADPQSEKEPGPAFVTGQPASA